MRPAPNSVWPLLCLTLATACTSTSADDAVEAAVDGAIVPAIEAFESDSMSFETAAGALCASPSEDQLRNTQDAWFQLMASWNRAGVYRIGPLFDDPIVPTIDLIESKRPRGTDYTQTVRDTIATDVGGDTTLDEAYFRGLNFNRGGLLALEVLLFEDGADPASNTPTDIVAAFADNPRRCEYLQGTAQLLHERAQGVSSGWTEAFGDVGTPFRDQFLSGTLPNGADSAVTLVVIAIEHARYLQRRKIDGVADVQLAAAARPDANPFFGNLEVAMLELEALFATRFGDAPSLYDVMEERGFTDEAEALRSAIAEVLVWVRDGSEEGASGALIVLDAVLQADVPRGLDIVLPLNFNDGD